MAFKQWKYEIAGRELVIEHGKMAKQSAGSVVVRLGDTVVLITANGKKTASGMDFFPLTVEFQEKFYSSGKIPGGFLKREGRPGDTSILAARQIDRPIRPLFPDGFYNEVQLIATVLSIDEDNPADVLGILGASLALNFSNIPFEGIVAGVKVGFVDGKPVVFPTEEELQISDIELTVAGSKDAIVMVEGEAKEVDEELMLEALDVAHNAIKEMCEFQERIFEEMGPVEKMPYEVLALTSEEKQKLESMVDKQELKERMLTEGKKNTEKALGEYKELILEKFMEDIEEDEKAIKQSLASEQYEEILKGIMRRSIVEDKKRSDGRDSTTIRPISCEIGVLPRVHGSALFTRGETQSLGILTLGSGRDVQYIDSIYEESEKNFMLHYNFPPFSVGEVKRLGSTSRREIGHGHLAERSVKSIMPSVDEFPYTVRVVSEILESNGSSSMATICSASLSLMDAGVPVKKHVAGIAMGMIKEPDETVILSDILGMEDHLGDMDFKVAGTRDGITGFQMDVKVSGISREIMAKALNQAKEGRQHILDIMYQTIEQPRDTLSEYAPAVVSFDIPEESIGEVIGPGGKMIKFITAEFDVKIEIDDEKGKVNIFGSDAKKSNAAADYIHRMLEPLEADKEYTGKVTRIEKYGVFIELAPGKTGLLHVSNMEGFVKDPAAKFNLGDMVKVVCGKLEPGGKIDLREPGSQKKMASNSDRRGRKPTERRENRK
ncbi:MAG TPA: polyribonucleotide nucleotidyltransferase [Thermotogota bacterium]|nr:polyribonucleotide nucleotidyltransferase [Thermotogota bacterium]